MNSYVSDPGIWILVAMVACVHATVLVSRRVKGRFSGDQLGLGFILCGVFGLVLFASLASASLGGVWHGLSVYVVITPLVCALVLGARAKVMEAACGWFVLGMLTSFLMARWNLSVLPPNGDWLSEEGAPFTLASQQVSAMQDPVQPGFLEPKPGSGIEILDTRAPVPVWHTFLTGIPAWRVTPYRIWTPGGKPSVAAANLRLVMAGDPVPNSPTSGTAELAKR